MSEIIPPRFRKTKTDKWAVMAPIADLEQALAQGGTIEVQKRSGDWSKFTVASLGRPFDVDGVQMCYGYGPGDESPDGTGSAQRPPVSAQSQPRSQSQSPPPDAERHEPSAQTPPPPPRDEYEPLPEYQGSGEDEWDQGF